MLHLSSWSAFLYYIGQAKSIPTWRMVVMDWLSLTRVISHQLIHCSTIEHEASDAVAYHCSRHRLESYDPEMLPSVSNSGIQ